MKKYICALVLLTINLVNAQTKSNDYFTLYKGGDKYLKPVKYVIFDSKLNENLKTEIEGKTFFQIKGERFIFNSKKHKKSPYSPAVLNKTKLSDPLLLQEEGYKFFKTKKDEVLKKKNITLIYPPAGYQPYFKIYLLEKINDKKIIKYEVDWEYAAF